MSVPALALPEISPGVPLSKSRLWTLQRDYFIREGVDAWRHNVVPSYVTSNAFIAHAYAELVLAYLRDLPDGKPLRILELGAGSGRFAHSFLKHFFSRHDGSRPVTYVMTDVSPANIDFWKGHERLQPFVQRGALDFAAFDAGQDETPLFDPGPLVVIANYVFDGIEQDLFEVKDGALYECRVCLSGEESAHDAALEYSLHACSDSYYQSPNWNAILAEHARALTDTAFLFPVGAFRCLESLLSVCDGRMMLLAGDKGQTTLEALRGRGKPDPARHGSFSFGVNFHALSGFARRMGGKVLQTPHAAASLNVLAYLFGGNDHCATRDAFRRVVTDFGPDDFFLVKKGAEKGCEALSLPQIVALLRLSRWDQAVLDVFYDRLIEVLPEASRQEKQMFRTCVGRIWDGHYPLGEDKDLAFRLGNLLAAAEDYAGALTLFKESLAAYGEDDHVRENMRLCWEHIGGQS